MTKESNLAGELAKLGDVARNLGNASFAGAGRTDDWETVEHARKYAPDVRFEGKLIAEVDSRDFAPAGKPTTRWTNLEVWELRSGRWVVCAVACSDKPDEIDYATMVEVIDAGEPDAMRLKATAAIGFTWLAKELYAAAGWDAVVTLT